jgi:hypothetical protein
MKTVKLVTHFTPEQAEDFYLFLDEIKTAIWQSYGEDIVKMHQDIATEKLLKEENDNFNDELLF